MTIKYRHEIGQHIETISGWYSIDREEVIDFKGNHFLYIVGAAAVESSCCGNWGGTYVVVPGAIVSWQHEVEDDGVAISEVDPIRDAGLQEKIKKIITERENINLVQFW